MYSFSYLEPVCCSMPSSNCGFLTCIQVSQEAGQLVWYSHLFKNFPQFVLMHTVKGFSTVNEAEVDFFFWMPCFHCFCMMTICWQFDLWASSNISSNLTQTSFPVTPAGPLPQPLAAYWPTPDGQWRFKHSTRTSTGTARAPGIFSSYTECLKANPC